MGIKSKIPLLTGVLIIIGLVVFFCFTTERDPAYQQHLTTWDGNPAFGQLHRDGWYSFYHISGRYIATFPAGEALHLH